MTQISLIDFLEHERNRLPDIFVYENLNINQKINYHSNDMYAPHFMNRYSFMMATNGTVPRWQTERPNRCSYAIRRRMQYKMSLISKNDKKELT